MMMMPVMVVTRLVKTAGTSTEMITQVAILDIASRGGHALPLDMMMMALLCQPDFILEPQNLRAVLAHRTVHVVAAFQNFADTVGKGGNHLGMVVQIACLDELGIGKRCRDLVGETVDPVDQNAAEQEIGKDHHTLEAKACHMLKAGLDKRECHTGIADFGPAEAHPFPQHAGNLRDVGVGIGVRCAATDDNKAGIRPVNLAMLGIGSVDSGSDPVTGSLQHLQIDGQLAAILDGDAMLGSIGVEHGGNIVFRVTRGKQHARHRQHMRHALFAQLVEPGLDHRRGKFQISVFHRPVREQRGQLFCQYGKFGNCGFRPRAMPTDHHAIFGRRRIMHGSSPRLRQTRQMRLHPNLQLHRRSDHPSCQKRQGRPRP